MLRRVIGLTFDDIRLTAEADSGDSPFECGRRPMTNFPIRAGLVGAISGPLAIHHSRMLLSLDFPRAGEVLEPSGIQTKF